AIPGTIKSCADFVSLIPAFLAGSLDDGRGLLLEAHTRECVACRHALSDARAGARQVIEFTPRKAARPYAGWAIAASVTLAAGAGAWYFYSQFPALAGGPRATVASIEGGLFRVSGDTLTPLAPGAELGENDSVRTSKASSAVLRLNDGSQIEMNQRAQVSVSRTWTGSTVHLALGSIIVEAAKQRRGTLQVLTADCDVSVKGTVFSVDAGAKGSRVAVVEGTVWVDHGQKHDVLHRGDITSTTPELEPVPIRSEFAWSRNSAQYFSLLGELNDIKRQIDAIPAPDLRHETKLMGYLPPDITAVAAIPNIGGTLKQASEIFHDHLKSSGQLNDWWMHLPARQRDVFETTIAQFATASGYLGNEIVIAAADGPVILAQTVKPGFDAYLKSQLPPDAYDGHVRLDNNLLIAAGNPKDLDRLTGGFTNSPLYRQIAPLYRQGAGWLFGVDLRGAGFRPAQNLAGARYIVGQSRTIGGKTENHASVVFAKDREGIASWLAAPGPMGSLDFISPDAGFAVSMLLRNPSLIVKDVTGMIQGSDLNSDLKNEIASSLGGEVTVALDGPLFPVPSWKLAAEVYYPERLQAAIAKAAADYNATPNHDRTGDLKMTRQDVDGRTFYNLKFDKLPWAAEWTFFDGYWIAAANRELIVRSIQNRETGYTLSHSKQFRDQLPHDTTANYSAVIYHSLNQALAPLNALLGSTNVKAPRFEDTPGAICFWAAPGRIDVATEGSIFGMKLESLLGFQGSSPLTLLRNMVGEAVSPVQKAAQ
ncbi:MAG: FecR domain-containing protein, partial [Acidobacteriota bacterium]|nr:FecR domain-containing protein [Acidobacteriota bacterium]